MYGEQVSGTCEVTAPKDRTVWQYGVVARLESAISTCGGGVGGAWRRDSGECLRHLHTPPSRACLAVVSRSSLCGIVTNRTAIPTRNYDLPARVHSVGGLCCLVVESGLGGTMGLKGLHPSSLPLPACHPVTVPLFCRNTVRIPFVFDVPPAAFYDTYEGTRFQVRFVALHVCV